VNVSPNDSGSIVVNRSVISVFPVIPSYDSGAEITLKALPVDGFKFDGWSGDVTGNDNPVTVIMDCNKTVTANFSKNQSYWWIIYVVIAGVIFICLIVLRTVVSRRR
jgi:uncharacterized repeat protein (TIGR02543 family)